MARVKVRLYATIRELAGTSELQIEAESVGDLIRGLSKRFGPIFANLVEDGKAGEGVVVLVNGRNVQLGSELKLGPGDEISIFPPVSGG